MKLLKKAVSILCVAALLANAAALTGCVFDLGTFEDEQAYVESFGTVSLTSFSGVRTFGVGEDFYNPGALEHFECHVPSDEYVTFVLPIEADMEIDEIRLCVNATENAALTVRMFIGSLDTPPFYNAFDEGGERPQMPVDHVAECVVSCVKGEWGYFSFSDFVTGDGSDGTVSVSEGDVITFLFINNTAWGKALELEQCEFALTALLVRAI